MSSFFKKKKVYHFQGVINYSKVASSSNYQIFWRGEQCAVSNSELLLRIS